MSEAERKRNTLREQLSRARGALADTLGISATARASKRAAAESKQRLSDVLWNDRTLAASHAAAPPPSAAPPVATPPRAGETSPRARLATPTPTPTSKPPPIPAGAFAPPRPRRSSPPPPSAAVPAVVLHDLEHLKAADERTVSPSPVPRTQPPPPPKARKPPAIPPKTGAAPQPSAASAAPRVPAAPPPISPGSAPPDEEDDDSALPEPICTRSMARLLAGQGHRQRALAMYEVLLKQNAADASLRAEADALRADS